jgi:hypothetical protein
MQYNLSTPPDALTEELYRAVLEDSDLHLELRLAQVEREFRKRLAELHQYIQRRTRERVKELLQEPPPPMTQKFKRCL